MTTPTTQLLNIDSPEVQRGEDLFVALARSYDISFYLGRLANASEEELRSVYGLTVATLRQASRDILNGINASEAKSESEKGEVDQELLASRLEQMTAELARRDEHIRELKSQLESGRKRG